jgi:hypothetical protein
MSSLGKEGTAVPMGGLDGVEADSTGRYIITLPIIPKESSLSSILIEQVMKL